MDCHVATLLAETALHRLPPPSASQRQKRVIANSTPSLRTPPRLCERSEAIHLANHAALNHGLPRRYAPRRDGNASLRAPPHHCEPHPVFPSATKQSTSKTTPRSNIDCHVDTPIAHY